MLPLAWLLSKEKGGEQKRTPCVPQQLTWGWEATRGCLGCRRAAQCLDPGAKGQTLCCAPGRCGAERAAPGDTEQRWLLALCTPWLSALTWATWMTHIQPGTGSSGWKQGSLRFPAFLSPDLELALGASLLSSPPALHIRVQSPQVASFWREGDKLSANTGNSLLTALGIALPVFLY